MTTSIGKNDRTILRGLAKRVADIAALPERVTKWPAMASKAAKEIQ